MKAIDVYYGPVKASMKALVSDVDYDLVHGYKWGILLKNKTPSVRTRVYFSKEREVTIYLHQMVALHEELGTETVTFMLNCNREQLKRQLALLGRIYRRTTDGLDNRRENLVVKGILLERPLDPPSRPLEGLGDRLSAALGHAASKKTSPRREPTGPGGV